MPNETSDKEPEAKTQEAPKELHEDKGYNLTDSNLFGREVCRHGHTSCMTCWDT